jgi:hypothetical protein
MIMEQALRHMQQLGPRDAEFGQRGVKGAEVVPGRLVGADVLGVMIAAKSPRSRSLLPANPARCTLDKMISW